MAPKRKLLEKQTGSRNRVTNKRCQSSQKSTSHFRFLDLIPELRNDVYSKIIEDTTLILPRTGSKRQSVLAPGLTRTCKEIRAEFLPLVLKNISLIQTTVRNWDFGHVVNFLNRPGLDKNEQILLQQSIMVNFEFTGENADPPGLMCWIERFDDGRRGDGVMFEYVCTDSAFSRQNWSIAGFRACASGGTKGHLQFEKIEAVFA